MTRLDLRGISLLDLVPESIASDPEVIAMAAALDPELQAVSEAIIGVVILPNIAELDESILNELGWAFRLNELQLWDSATVEGKRALLVNIFAIRKKSGTRFAVRRIFDLVSVVGMLIEWWEEGAAPFSYRLLITVGDVGITAAQLSQTQELTYRFAPARAWLREIGVETNRQGPLLLYPALTVGQHITIPFGGP